MSRREPGRARVIGSGCVLTATPPMKITSVLSDALPPLKTITAAFALAHEFSLPAPSPELGSFVLLCSGHGRLLSLAC